MSPQSIINLEGGSSGDFLVVFTFVGIFILLCFLIFEVLEKTQNLFVSESPVYGYSPSNGPLVWASFYPDAGGSNQSPVDIIPEKTVVTFNPKYPMMWTNYSEKPWSMVVENDGNTVWICAKWSQGKHPSVKGGPLAAEYLFSSIRFHWGNGEWTGSEHSLNSVRFAMEMQVICCKKKYKTPQEAINAKDKSGLAIFSYLFQMTPANNPWLENVVSSLQYVIKPGSMKEIAAFPLEWVYPAFAQDFYSYSGSLTEPPCSEIVTWIIQPAPLPVSHSQMKEFREICSSSGQIQSNCRPVQDVNKREIYYYE